MVETLCLASRRQDIHRATGAASKRPWIASFLVGGTTDFASPGRALLAAKTDFLGAVCRGERTRAGWSAMLAPHCFQQVRESSPCAKARVTSHYLASRMRAQLATYSEDHVALLSPHLAGLCSCSLRPLHDLNRRLSTNGRIIGCSNAATRGRSSRCYRYALDHF